MGPSQSFLLDSVGLYRIGLRLFEGTIPLHSLLAATVNIVINNLNLLLRGWQALGFELVQLFDLWSTLRRKEASPNRLMSFLGGGLFAFYTHWKTIGKGHPESCGFYCLWASANLFKAHPFHEFRDMHQKNY